LFGANEGATVANSVRDFAAPKLRIPMKSATDSGP